MAGPTILQVLGYTERALPLGTSLPAKVIARTVLAETTLGALHVHPGDLLIQLPNGHKIALHKDDWPYLVALLGTVAAQTTPEEDRAIALLKADALRAEGLYALDDLEAFTLAQEHGGAHGR